MPKKKKPLITQCEINPLITGKVHKKWYFQLDMTDRTIRVSQNPDLRYVPDNVPLDVMDTIIRHAHHVWRVMDEK